MALEGGADAAQDADPEHVMTQPATLTLAIPTFNRAFYLTTAIGSLRAQANTSNRWRVVVANNNSTDDTAAQLAAVAADWPRLEVLFVPAPGASIARNQALERAGADYILYADDECKFPSDFIDRALAIIDRHGPKMFGGPILPWYVTPPPVWLPPDYGSYSLPWATGHSDRVSFSAGNMGFETSALRAIGGFDPARGPRGAQMAFGEETAVETLMLERFGPDAVWFDPEFFNFHAVRPEKYVWRNLLREQFQRGQARAQLIQDGVGPANSGLVPECLKPRPMPASGPLSHTRADRPSLQQKIAHLAFGITRRAGALWGHHGSRS